MVVVTLVNFKCYENYTLTFPDGEVSLLYGKSGKGKSTILQAIMWCLHDKPRNVAPKNGKNLETIVTVKISDLVISRYKNPKRFTVETPAGIHSESIAQNIVNSRFGSYESWLSSCYTQQKVINAFISSSNRGKLELLSELTFHDQDPAEVIAKIRDEITVQTAKYNIEKDKMEYDVSILTEKLKECDTSCYRSDDELEKLKLAISDKEGKFNKLTKQKQVNDTKKQRLQKYHEKLNSLVLPDFTSDKSLELSDLSAIISAVIIVEKIKSKLENLVDHGISTDLNFGQLSKDINKAVKHETSNDFRKSILSKYNNPDPKIRIEELEKLKLCVEYNKLKDIQLEEPIRGEILPIDNPPLFPDLEEKQTELDEVAQIAKEIRIQTEIYKCPKCKSQLCLKNRKLECTGKIDDDEITIDEVNDIIKDLKKEIAILQKNKSHQEFEYSKELAQIYRHNADVESQYDNDKLRYDQNKKKLEKLDLIKEKLGDYVCPTTIPENIHDEYIALSNLPDYHVVEMSSSELRSKYDMAKEQQEYNQHMEELDNYNIPEEYKDLSSSKLIKLDKLSKAYLERKLEYDNILAKRNSINLKLESIVLSDDVEEELQDLDEEINNFTAKLLKVINARELKAEHSRITEHRKEIILLNKDIQKCKSILSNATKVECRMLNQTVDSINSSINHSVKALFDDPISLDLALYRETKSKKITQSVNMKIGYRGIEFDSATDMSGGEMDRVSLALTLALNRISGCPILMLDETLGSLDDETRTEVVESIKEITNSTVIITLVTGSKSGYDNIIEP